MGTLTLRKNESLILLKSILNRTLLADDNPKRIIWQTEQNFISFGDRFPIYKAVISHGDNLQKIRIEHGIGFIHFFLKGTIENEERTIIRMNTGKGPLGLLSRAEGKSIRKLYNAVHQLDKEKIQKQQDSAIRDMAGDQLHL